MEQLFNVIDEPWICVMDKNCQIKEVSLRDTLLKSQDFIELAGETKAQDFAILRFLLALMYTIFYRYDLNGEKFDVRENKDLVMDNWEEMWKNKYIPSEPVERYFEEWRERFWLFDEKFPFYQSNSVNGKTKPVSTAKMIGTLFESNNKKRLFSERKDEGRNLSYSEAARWLLHLNCFDDIAAKAPTPKRPWVGHLGLIALKGENLFEMLMLNFLADCDVDNDVYDEYPSWEQNNFQIKFNDLINVPKDQAALLSLISRRILLCRDSENIENVNGYYISGGNYFEDTEVFQEKMTLWSAYQEKKNSPFKFKPKRHNAEKKLWQEFGSITGANEKDSEKTKAPGVVQWLRKLYDAKILNRSYMAQLSTVAVIYDYGQLMTLPVIDTISDSLTFHAQLLGDLEKSWRERIQMEIEKCDKASYYVIKLYKDLQFASGRQDKDSKTSQSGEIDAKMRFYDEIDRPFRLWLEGLKPDENDNLNPDEYLAIIEKELKTIALRLGDSFVPQVGNNTIFGRAAKKDDNKNNKEKNKQSFESSAQALNFYRAMIRKIFDKAGEQI